MWKNSQNTVKNVENHKNGRKTDKNLEKQSKSCQKC